MSLKDRITEDMKAAMRAKESARLAAIRLLLAALKQREVDERIELDDLQVIQVIEKMLKQRRDSVTQYDSAGRADLAAVEKAEIAILSDYLPQPLSAAEVAGLIDEAIAGTGAQGIKDMGRVMAVLRPQVVGRADMAEVSAQIKVRLGGA